MQDEPTADLTPEPDEAETVDFDDPVLEFYRGPDAVLSVVAVGEGDDELLLLLDAGVGGEENDGEVMVTEFEDLDVLFEASGERIEQVVATAPIIRDDATAEEAWQNALLAISPAAEPVLVARSESGHFLVLDPVEVLDDGRPGQLGAYDSLVDAIWRGIEFLADEDGDGDDNVDRGDGTGA
jgi:hypothetical protein